jgi:hypothetical protein
MSARWMSDTFSCSITTVNDDDDDDDDDGNDCGVRNNLFVHVTVGCLEHQEGYEQGGRHEGVH